MTRKYDLLPCPHCGGTPATKSGVVRNNSTTERVAWVRCSVCGARTNSVRKALYSDYVDRAVALWNMRDTDWMDYEVDDAEESDTV